ncbi:hypothetical protein [Stenotrophomonas rhizophila]|nr:hypothetical protein [Stenotrophomonas rhizophila]
MPEIRLHARVLLSRRSKLTLQQFNLLPGLIYVAQGSILDRSDVLAKRFSLRSRQLLDFLHPSVE